ncbi:lytic transglycosylase domain-containing protein [Dyella sp. M7H15-1]|uniref:M23 family metallopeptidase n=1 Tax=Dyella sp. M7H15-1 TaxID=2501295 RepID=UPI001004FAF9|nr:M23 family metallopeptidase [Dyella sp. M7H15-1]QAU24624.1 lytic transglycosylase domain-containing protein [Dyella sp. M7H15-1]
MSFDEVMQRMLPEQQGKSAHITDHYGATNPIRNYRPHDGVDFNYTGGQNGLNLTHPTINSPVDGEVTFVGGQFGTIKIRDVEGYSHEILHTNDQSVQVGQRVASGGSIGTMGGRGPGGPTQFAQHVHYQIEDPQGKRINPQEWWNQREANTDSALALNPVKAWSYPFRAKDGRTEITGRQTFFGAFSQMDDGYFPIGVNGFPHGGVHFGAATAGSFDQADGVRCIADGEIVAYKLDDTYPKLHFTQDDHWAMYSTGFVLVRHTLALPSVPNSPVSASDTQTLYSLAMHMADWSTYLAEGALKRPGWWIGVEAFRIGNADRQRGGETKGARVRTEPKADTRGRYTAGALVGFLPEGSEVRIGEKHGPWGHIISISAGGMISPDSGGTFGGDDDLNGPWYAPGNDKTRPVTPRGDWGWIYLHEQHAVTAPTGVGSVVIPPEPIPIKAGTLLGQLGEYIDYERSTPLPPLPMRQLLHLEVFAGEDFKAFLDRSRARAAQLPAEQKTVLMVKAGTRFVASATPSDRQLADMYPSAFAEAKPTADSPSDGPWVKVQPMYRSPWGHHDIERDGSPVWIERDKLAQVTATTPAWSRFPLQVNAANGPTSDFIETHTRAELEGLDGRDRAVDDQGHRWWRFDVGTADGKSTTGWLSQNHPGSEWVSPWAWPGFEVVDATGIALTDAFQRNLVVTGSADWQEAGKYKEAVERVNASPLLRRLEQVLGKHVRKDTYGRELPKNKYSIVTARALQEAMRLPWLASEISHLILRYESEWSGNMGRWEAITPLMRHARQNWECEVQRIHKLQWWNEVKGKVAGFPDSPVVYHIHPIALVGNFEGACPESCKTKVVEFQTSEGIFQVSKRAFEFVLSTEDYRAHPYVPSGDQSSGVTVGYGYDLGQQTSATIASELSGIFSPEQITSLQQASGLHGDTARNLLPSLANISISRDMALRLAVVMKGRYAQYTVDAFPGVTKLHPHCQGALLSLVINRGPGLVDKPHQKTREQMRSIKSDIENSKTKDVPVQLRSMKSLWAGSGQGGLVERREQEAILFESGMTCNCWR